MKNKWKKKTKCIIQDIDGNEYSTDEIIRILNHYQDRIDRLNNENYEIYCLLERMYSDCSCMITEMKEFHKIRQRCDSC